MDISGIRSLWRCDGDGGVAWPEHPSRLDNKIIDLNFVVALQGMAYNLCLSSYVSALRYFLSRVFRVKFWLDKMAGKTLSLKTCESGGIGRRAGLRIQWGNL